jgi:hypothetical protein
MADVCVFEDLDRARAFRDLRLKAGESPKDLWEPKSLPIVVSEGARLRQKPDSARIFRPYYPIAYARIIEGLDFIISQRIDAINLSLGPEVGDELADDDPLVFAVEECLRRGVIVVVAAGNCGPKNDTMQPLAKIGGVISVGAVGPDRAVLSVSSRGPEGGFGPTVVSFGLPEVTFIKEGWKTPVPATSYAAPRVTRVAVVVLKAMQLVWTSYEKISTASWDKGTRPLPLSVIGFADTGIDPRGLPPLPERVGEHLYSQGEFVSFATDDRQRHWFEKVHETFQSCPMMGVTLYTVRHAIEMIATPLPLFQRHEVGAGFVALNECQTFLTTLTPTRFIQLFNPGDAGAELAKEHADLDLELGPLWDTNYADMIIEYFYSGHRLVVAKVY